jgi:diaminopimelate epimerase
LKEKGFGRDVKFYTKSGKIRARVSGKSVKVSVGTPKNLRLYIPIEPMIHFVEVGVPHAVIFCDVESADVENVGRRIRYHKVFGKDGTNCNFVQLNEKLRIRTYERGVEAETGSCGTGAAAAAFISHTIHNIQFPVEVEPTSKESFYVDFEDGMLFIEGEVRTE